MQKIRVGVIGLGMGRGHVHGFKSHEAAEVVAIADINEERLKTFGDEQNIPSRYTDAEEMIASEKLDVISIATPNMLHKPLTLAAFEAGAHVFCEKPMALNAKEGREMVEAAKAAGKRLMINFSFRFTKQSWALKSQVDQGVLGDIYFGRTSWHRRRGLPGLGGWFGQKALSGGGPLIDLGVHRLDLALWLMGYPKPTWVMGSTYSHLADKIAAKEGKAFDVEDLAAAHLDALTYLRDGGKSTTLNCGYGHGYSVREVLAAVEKITGEPLNISEEPRRDGDPPELIAVAKKIQSVLGWTPKFDDLDTIVRTSLEWERKIADRDKSAYWAA